MKHYFRLLVVAAAFALIACNKEETVPVPTTFSSKLDSGLGAASWAKDDAIFVYSSKDQIARKFTVESGSGSTTAQFTGNVLRADTYYAIYPISAVESWDGTTFKAKIQSTQTAVANKANPAACISVAKGGKDLKLDFKYAVGFISFTGNFGSHTVKEVKIKANELLAGTSKISMAGDTPSITVTSGFQTVKLAGNTSIAAGTKYMFAVYPGKYTGVKFTAVDANGVSRSIDLGAIEVTRNGIKELSNITITDDDWNTPDEGEEDDPYFNGISGFVKWTDGSPVAGVSVSDGFKVATTNSKGYYRLDLPSSDCRYIYISMPADAKITKNSYGNPDFYTKYVATTKQYDFTLTKQAVETDFALFAMADPQAHYTARSPQTSADTYRFQVEAVPSINKQIAAQGMNCYGVTLGDIVYSEGSRNSNNGIATMRNNFKLINMPTFQSMGNHDYTYFYSTSGKELTTDETSSTLYLKAQRSFEDIFGPINLSFNRGQCHIVCMRDIIYDSNTDASSYHCGFTDDQYNWFKQDIANVPSDVAIILCVHIPLAGCTGSSNTHVLDIMNLMKSHPNSTVFSGHTHYYRGYANCNGTGMYEHIHSAVCGQWWWSTIEGDGCPAGYTIYKMNKNSIKDAYFIGFNDQMNTRDYQIRAYKGNITTGGSVAKFNWGLSANTLLINVFNGDSRWKVQVYENGTLSGTASMMANSKKTLNVTKGNTYDVPSGSNQDWWAIGYHIGVVGRGTGTSTSYYTNMFHMWKYVLKDANATVKIVATDPFGTEYTCTEVVTDGTNYPSYIKAAH